MRRMVAAVACLAAGAPDLAAQEHRSRSADYLFVTGPADIRALWVNPASLSIVAQASLMGEVSFGRGATDDWRTSQYSFGLSSRGVGLGYQRDRLENGPNLGTWRLAGSVNLGRGAFGTAMTFHEAGRSWDVGLRFAPSPPVHFAAVVRNIGRPAVGDSVLRITGIFGLGWQPGRSLRLSGELISTEQRPAAGYFLSYRAGLQLGLSGRSPLALMGTLQLNEELRVTRWNAGLVIGSLNQLVGVTGGRRSQARTFESASLSAVSTRILK